MAYGSQPVFTALEEEKDECLANKASAADSGDWIPGSYSSVDDFMSFPFVSLGYEQFPGRNIQEYEMLPSDPSNRGHDADCLMSPAATSMGYGILDIPMNLTTPMCETRTGYPIKTHGADAQNSRISRFQMSGQFPPSKCSTSMLPLVDNFGAAGNTNDIIFPRSSISPQKIDRNFLTLGIGGGIDVRPNSNFSTREISNKLEEVSSQFNNPIAGHCPKNLSNPTQFAFGDASRQSNAGALSKPDSNFSAKKLPNKLEEEVSYQFNNSSVTHWPKNHMSLAQVSGGDARIQPNAGVLSTPNSNFHTQANASKLEVDSFKCNNSIVGNYPTNLSDRHQLAGGPAMIQTNAGQLSRPNLGSGMPARVEGGFIGDTGLRLNSTPCLGLQKLQANNIPPNTPNYTSVSLKTPHSLPFRSTLFSQAKCSSQPEIDSTYFASQPISRHHDNYRKSSMNVPSESSRNYLPHMHKQGSIGHVQPGQFDAFQKVSPVEAPGNYITPEKIGFQFSKSSAYQSAAGAGAGCFPKRLGLQPNDYANAQFARGPAPDHFAAYLNQFRPTIPTGQHQHVLPTQSPAVFPKVDHSNGQVVPVAKLDVRPQVAPIISRQPLKRKAFANPSALSAQQRKIFLQLVGNGSTLQQSRRIPSTPAADHIPPSPPLHVKWKGFDEPPEPTGKRCLLCKRDLSFTAKGPIFQPTAPPPVAILPCGHTFHDHCLQVITPDDQSKIPPCIPCAVGEA